MGCGRRGLNQGRAIVCVPGSALLEALLRWCLGPLGEKILRGAASNRKNKREKEVLTFG